MTPRRPDPDPADPVGPPPVAAADSALVESPARAPAPPVPGPLGVVSRVVAARPGAIRGVQYLGFAAAALAAAAAGAPLLFQLGFGFMGAMTSQVWVQSLPTRLSRRGRQAEAARLARVLGDAGGGELRASHRLDEAEFWTRSGDQEAAKAALARVDLAALPAGLQGRYFLVAANLWMAVGDPDGALVMSDAAFAQRPNPGPELLLHRALALYGAGREAEALARLEEAEAGDLRPAQRRFLDAVRGVIAGGRSPPALPPCDAR